MPRISNALIRQARHISPLLPLLLRPCRDLTSALNEFRWLREHATKVAQLQHCSATPPRQAAEKARTGRKPPDTDPSTRDEASKKPLQNNVRLRGNYLHPEGLHVIRHARWAGTQQVSLSEAAAEDQATVESPEEPSTVIEIFSEAGVQQELGSTPIGNEASVIEEQPRAHQLLDGHDTVVRRLDSFSSDIPERTKAFLAMPEKLKSYRREVLEGMDFRKMSKQSKAGFDKLGYWPAYKLLRRFVKARSNGEPLQYILGTEYFGDLELAVSKQVLIPRWETAASVEYLARHLSQNARYLPNTLKVLDLCSGSGCISLLFQHEFNRALDGNVETRIVGFDHSPYADRLAKYNQALLRYRTEKSLNELRDHSGSEAQREIPALQRRLASLDSDAMQFRRANLLDGDNLGVNDSESAVLSSGLREALRASGMLRCDVLISNPPYISRKEYYETTARSVRHFEPRMALVPPPINSKDRTDPQTPDGDRFYPQLLNIADATEAKVVVLEVSGQAQAARVASMALNTGKWDHVEIWRDEPGAHASAVRYDRFKIRGQGNFRSVLCLRGETTRAWLGDHAKVKRG